MYYNDASVQSCNSSQSKKNMIVERERYKSIEAVLMARIAVVVGRIILPAGFACF